MLLYPNINNLVPSFVRYVKNEASYFSSPDAGRLHDLLFPVIPVMVLSLIVMVIAVMLHLYRKQRRFH